MSLTSRTGLTASPTKKIYRREKVTTLQLRAFARPAPFVLKPFAGLYNPYPYGCSLLCNHPTDNEAKELLKKAKDTWANEGKNVLLAEEIEAIRAGFEHLQPNDKDNQRLNATAVESVPEELFRRYTETDSRPLTPAPTLASAATRASGSRRCFTPDPLSTNQIREKTLLILDLRRSHSQETLSWHGSSLQEPPIIRIQRVPTRQPSSEESYRSPKTKSPTHLLTSPTPNVPRSQTPNSVKGLKKKTKEAEEASVKEKHEEKKSEDEEDNDEEFVKRRGKKRRKKREGSGGPPPVQMTIDPETQVATIGPDSHNPSARASLVPETEEQLESVSRRKSSVQPPRDWDFDSYLDVEILKQLRRELNEEVIDNEFNQKRRTALQEALKTIPKEKTTCEALVKLQNELKLPPMNADLWLSLPRIFTRSSARFELPLDSRTLEGMTPIQYVQNHVTISSPRKLLYNCIFNKFKIEFDQEGNSERKISGKNIQNALNLMMGKPMTEKQQKYFHSLIGWLDDDVMDFKTFCGLCALCERLLAPEYCPQLPDRRADPCHEIESADFEALTRKLHGKKVSQNLVEILQGIKIR